MRHALFPLDELEPGRMRAVTVGDLDVVVVRTSDGTVHALRDRCPHARAPLSKGRLLDKVVGDDAGEYRLDGAQVLRCPWHGYEFDLGTGRCLADPRRVRVRTYTVTVDDGTVWLERAGPGAS